MFKISPLGVLRKPVFKIHNTSINDLRYYVGNIENGDIITYLEHIGLSSSSVNIHKILFNNKIVYFYYRMDPSKGNNFVELKDE
jgi:hypothetical protein